ncbi:MAG: diguanylate cyclase [Hyphomonadaceae bacterium]|nr:diguanylate cyclase [Hyphomonadaceae bacterium]
MAVESREYFLRVALLVFGLVVAYLSLTDTLADPDALARQPGERALATSLAMFIAPISTALAIHDRISVRHVPFEEDLANRTDPLTGLLSRDSLFSALERLRFESEVYEEYFFLILEVNGLKSISAEHGRKAGEAVVMHVANSLRCFTGPDMYLGRLSDAELIISGLAASLGSVQDYAQRVIEYVEADDRYYAGLIIRVTACVGICRADHEGPIANVVARAGTMMGQARQTGADKIILYS